MYCLSHSRRDGVRSDAPDPDREQDLSVRILHEVVELSVCEAGVMRVIALNQELTSIGRSSTQDVVISDARISRRHATIVRKPGAYEVIDQGSTHGTFVNGVRVERAILTPRDLLQLGSQHGPELWLRVRQATDDDSTPESQASLPSAALTGLLTPAEELRPAERMQQLSFLISAARQLNESGGTDEILHGLLQLTLQLTGAERGFVFLADDVLAGDVPPRRRICRRGRATARSGAAGGWHGAGRRRQRLAARATEGDREPRTIHHRGCDGG